MQSREVGLLLVAQLGGSTLPMNAILIFVAVLLVGSALSGWRGRRQGR
jgi:hypothetical protein